MRVFPIEVSRERLETLGHYLTACIVALTGAVRLGALGRYFSFVVICWLCAAGIAAAAAAREGIERRFRPSRAVLYLVEALFFGFLAAVSEYWGETAMPFVWLTGGLALLGTAILLAVRLVRAPRLPDRPTAPARDENPSWGEADPVTGATAGAAATPWWKGARGEWYVVGQILLIALVAIGPRTIGGWPGAGMPLAGVLLPLGVGLILVGGYFFLAGIVRLGPNLTPLPVPREGSTFVEQGPYALVRHPIYGGGLMGALGWALVRDSWLTLGYVAILFVFFDVKSRHEERWLMAKFPGYPEYQRRVRRLLPFIY